MTNEEAKDYLTALWGSDDISIDETIALEMAIKALEQQPCEDAISRQAVNDLVDELARAISDERCYISRGRSTATIMQDILDLPPATPKEKSEYEHDHDVVKAYNDGQAYTLDRIRAEIERLQKEQSNHYGNETETAKYDAYDDCLDVINKYRGE